MMRRVPIATLALLIAVTPYVARAARPPQYLTLPMPTPLPYGATIATGHGLTVTIDATALVGIGYCPVEVTVNAANPSTAVRSFTFKLGPSRYGGSRVPVEVQAALDMPAGATSAVTVVRVPLFLQPGSLKFTFWEDGRELADLSQSLSLHSGIHGRPILWLTDAGHPTLSGENWQNSVALSRNSPQASFILSDLPLDYSQWSVVLLSIYDLEKLIAERSGACKALRQWVCTGGALWVYSANPESQRLPKLDQLLESMSKPTSDVDANESEEWRLPLVGDELSAIEAATIVNRYRQNLPEEEKLVEQQRAQLKKRLKKPPFAVRNLGAGIVAALDTANPAGEHQAYWDFLIAHMSSRGHTWVAPHGINFNGTNSDFWNFMIPGVGLAPIGAFMVLITLFVIAIGPVNYYLLRRYHRQSLLMITVPGGAGLITGSLLIYAICADGFAIRSRARSFTEIDQRRGEAVCCSRLAYYAGMRPSSGLEFSSATAVYPIELDPDFDSYYQSSRERQVEQGRTRRFLDGWLQARVITQLYTVRARNTSARLDIAPSTIGGPPRVTNHLQTAIHHLLIIDESGKFAWGDGLADGASIEVQTLTRDAALTKVGSKLQAQRLKLPDDFAADRSGLFSFRRRSYYSYGNQTGYGHVLGNSLEAGMLRAMLVDDLPPRSYVAVVERSPEFEPGLASTDSQGEFHVILGRW